MSDNNSFEHNEIDLKDINCFQSTPIEFNNFQNNKIINTLRSQQSLNTDEIKYLPGMLLEMQDALMKSNTNMLELRQTLENLLFKNKEMKSKLNESSQQYILIKNKYHDCLNDIKKLRNKEEAYAELIDKADEEIKKIKAENKQIIKKYNMIKREFMDLEQNIKEIGELKNNILSMKKETEALLKENEILRLKERERPIVDISKETLKNLKLKISELENIINKENQDKIYYQSKYNKLQNDLIEKDKVIEEGLINYNSITKDLEISDGINSDLKVEVCLLKRVVMSLLENIISDENIVNDIAIELNYNDQEFNNYVSHDYKFNYNKKVINFRDYLRLCKAISSLGEEISNKYLNIKEENSHLKQIIENSNLLINELREKYYSLRGNLRVMVRVRPRINEESLIECFKISPKSDCISIINEKKDYLLDYIFNQDTDQNDIFKEISPIVKSLFNGRNACVISYGATGTGKTYTIQGNRENKGIALFIANEILTRLQSFDSNLQTENSQGKQSTTSNQTPHFNKVDKKSWSFGISVIEVYNDNIYNLLSDKESSLLNIYENIDNTMLIPDLNPVEISNISECEKILRVASKLRQTSSTSFNSNSSRSHCVITYHIKYLNSQNEIIRARFNLVDLAGSERLSRNLNTIDDFQKKEMSSIHLTLNALANVLYALASQQNHIPYRDSKLTHYLKESLGEGFNIFLLLHVSPCYADISESISTLEFGTKIAKLCKFKLANN